MEFLFTGQIPEETKKKKKSGIIIQIAVEKQFARCTFTEISSVYNMNPLHCSRNLLHYTLQKVTEINP